MYVRTGSVGWEARIEGGLLRESSDLRQQVLEDGPAQKDGGSRAWKRGDRRQVGLDRDDGQRAALEGGKLLKGRLGAEVKRR